MHRNQKISGLLGAAVTVAVTATLTLPIGPATAGPAPAPKPKPSTGDMREPQPDLLAKELPLSRAGIRKLVRESNLATQKRLRDPQVGDVMPWLGLDDVTGRLYLKSYRLRGIGDHIEVWVATNTAFPNADCRNDLGLTQVTDAQVDGLIQEFDSNIYPIESDAFATPPDLDGTDSILAGFTGLDYQVSADRADNIVTLVDNVRDANYYTPTEPDGQTYIAGFFSGQFNDLTDRNVMTIDAFDWLHRTGANPPDDSADPAYQACANALGGRTLGASRPHAYEGIFAHEYQHLLHHYSDSDEVSWVNEGLSDYAMALTGYTDPSLAPDDPKADSHLACIQGFMEPRFGGPENSLTLWGDQGGPQILCDYGAAFTFTQYLADRYGADAMSELFAEPENGLAGLDAVLDAQGASRSAMDTVHDWAAMLALDTAIASGRKLTGGDSRWLSSTSLSAKINWDNPEAYDEPGAPPNGSDYVRFRNAAGRPFTAQELKSVQFTGSRFLEPTPVEWTVTAAPPDNIEAEDCAAPPAPGSGPAALYSGCGDLLDRSIAHAVSVPSTGGQLVFDTLYDIEASWDFAFVQVSTDGGQTWTSLPTENTTSEHDPGAIAAVVSNLPGLTGDSGGWVTQHADLSAYAGQNILVGFRYLTDPAASESGFWIRNITAAGTPLPSDTLTGWRSYSQISPTPVSGYTVQLIGYDAKGRSWIYRLPLTAALTGGLTTPAGLSTRLGRQAEVVAAIIMQDDPTETVTQPARYQLRVNGVLQPGG